MPMVDKLLEVILVFDPRLTGEVFTLDILSRELEVSEVFIVIQAELQGERSLDICHHNPRDDCQV